MKPIKTSLYKHFFVGLMLIGSLGCNQKKDDGGTPVVPRGEPRTTGNNNPANTTPNMQGYTAQTVNLSTNYSGNALQQTVANFLSGSYAPEDLGQVQGIDLKGQVVIDPNTGSMIPGQSYVELTIRDNLVIDGQNMKPIIVQIPGKQGHAMNFNADLVFEDQYGQVRVTGNYREQFQGTVSFQNYSPSTSGTLGSFSISTCGFFYCN